MEAKRGRDNSKAGHSKKAKTESSSPVEIQSLSLKGDYVTIINKGTDSVDLTSWTLVSAPEEKQVYKFPEGYTLKGGATVTIW